MKHIKNFNSFVNEQNINEANVSKSDVKKLQKLGYNAELRVSLYDSHDEIKVTDGPNPWGDLHVYDYYWNGKKVWSDFDDGRQGSDYKKDVTSVDGFIDAMKNNRFWSD